MKWTSTRHWLPEEHKLVLVWWPGNIDTYDLTWQEKGKFVGRHEKDARGFEYHHTIKDSYYKVYDDQPTYWMEMS